MNFGTAKVHGHGCWWVRIIIFFDETFKYGDETIF
jgi:hypothetical protein